MPSEAPPVLGLRELQQRFYTLAVAPEGVSQGLRDLHLDVAELEKMVVGDARLSSVARLDVYADMYFFRIRDVLRDDYAKVRAAVGDPAFHNLVVEFLQQYPPTHASIRDAGARLPELLAKHSSCEKFPWLADLARLERARLETWDGFADAEPLTLDALRSLAPEAFATLRLQLIPAHIVLRCRHAVGAVWSALEQASTDSTDSTDSNQPAIEAAARPSVYLIWRQGLEVFHRSITEVEDGALSLAQRGEPFGLLCEHLATLLGDEEAPRAAFDLLARWTGDGCLVSTISAAPAVE